MNVLLVCSPCICECFVGLLVGFCWFISWLASLWFLLSLVVVVYSLFLLALFLNTSDSFDGLIEGSSQGSVFWRLSKVFQHYGCL